MYVVFLLKVLFFIIYLFIYLFTFQVNREVVLHKGHRNFFIHSWDSHGHKITVPVSVVHPEHHRGKHHHGAHTNFNIQHHSTEVDSINNTEVGLETLFNGA